MVRFFKYILIFYLGLAFLFWSFHPQLLFQPTFLPTDFQYNFKSSFKEVNFEPENDVRLNALWFSSPAVQKKRKIVLFFHGNRDNLTRWGREYTERFTNCGYDVLMYDYRGYGKSRGVHQQARPRLQHGGLTGRHGHGTGHPVPGQLGPPLGLGRRCEPEHGFDGSRIELVRFAEGLFGLIELTRPERGLASAERLGIGPQLPRRKGSGRRADERIGKDAARKECNACAKDEGRKGSGSIHDNLGYKRQRGPVRGPDRSVGLWQRDGR